MMVDSILVQTFHDFELLLIDDGSNDASSVMIDNYAKKDARIRVFHKTNGGLSDARNYGLDRALGNYIVFADCDDYKIPYRYRLITWILKNKTEKLFDLFIPSHILLYYCYKNK